MRITDVRVFELEGPERTDLGLYHDPRYDQRPGDLLPYCHRYCEIETDAGLTGLAYCEDANHDDVWPVVKDLGREILGEDPMRTEYIWERLYTSTYARYFRMSAISVLDFALWDLKGKVYGEPVFRLLGGPTRDRIRAYASMLFFPTEPEEAARYSAEWVAKGFTALKWYPPYGARDGHQGLEKNVSLIRAVREAVGDDVDILIDGLFTNPAENNPLYVTKLAKRLEPYCPGWLEEFLSFDDLDAYAHLARATKTPIALGEHWYTRWQFRQILETGAATVLQPDPIHAGGITEMRKIIDLASTFGAVVVPHAHGSLHATAHLAFAMTDRLCPLAEWGVRTNPDIQYFCQGFYEPRDGHFYPPEGPGLGWRIDESKVAKRIEL